MATIKYAEEFFADATAIISPKLQEELRRTLLTVTDFPEIGSSRVPDSIRRTYGSGIRKITVGPFLLVYRYSKKEEVVFVYDLIYTRTVR